MERAHALYTAAGQTPVTLSREIHGFLLNRVQAAVLDECFKLFEQGLASAEDIDKVLKDGLALRWSFMGPFETIDLNAPAGVMDYAKRYGQQNKQTHGRWPAVRLGRRHRGPRRCRAPQATGHRRHRHPLGLARPPPDGAGRPQAPSPLGLTELTPPETHMSRKVIITCAVTGAIHTPSMSPYLPVTPDEIAESAIGAAEAGAAIVHLHARDPADGSPSQDPALFKAVPAAHQGRQQRGHQPHHRRRAHDVRGRAAAPGARVQARGGVAQHGVDEHGPVPHAEALQGVQARVGGALPRAAATTASSRTPSPTSRTSCESCSDNGTRFEIECYDIGHLYTAAHFIDRGLIKPPFLIQSVFGILGGIGAHPEDVIHMRRTADRLVRRRLPVVGAAGRPQPDAHRRAGGGHGRARARRPGGFAVEWPWPAGQDQCRTGPAHAQHPRRRCRWQWPRPTRHARFLQLKGGDNVAF